MPSIVWGRGTHEAYKNPYEYDAQDQFVREAKALLDDLIIRLSAYTMRFHRDAVTLEKATWMLSLDLVDALMECTLLLEEKRHRPASRLFRDSIETIDLLKVLHSGTDQARITLVNWYSNETISHGEMRKYLASVEGEEAIRKRREFYFELSKFTHRTYRALSDSFSLGRDDLLVHDNQSIKMLVLPQTIAAYLAILASLIVEALDSLSDTGIISSEELAFAVDVSIEKDSMSS